MERGAARKAQRESILNVVGVGSGADGMSESRGLSVDGDLWRWSIVLFCQLLMFPFPVYSFFVPAEINIWCYIVYFKDPI